MKTDRITLLAFTIMTCMTVSAQPRISEWVQSTRGSQWQEKAVRTTKADKATLVLDINPADALQTVEGFGSCFNEQGWASLSALPAATVKDIMAELYRPGHGACFTMGRMPIGANDFSLNYYSYNETDGDFDMHDFTIDHDRALLLPFIKAAMQYQPSLKMWASPWCPPKWMKAYKFYAEASDVNWNNMISEFMSRTGSRENNDPLRFRMTLLGNGTPANRMGYEGTTSFNMTAPYLKAYAKYFGLFIDAYKKEGIDIFMVMPQNEPNSAQPYPACCWTAADLNTFVGRYLGPEMARRGVKVFAGTCERPDPLKPDTLLSDPVTRQYVSGAGFQWAGKAALPVIHKKYPTLALYGSEQECGNGLNNWEGAMHSWELMREYFTNGVTAYFYWNTSLFDNEPSTWGWYQNSLVAVDRAKGTYRFTPEYYVMKHASHFVKPGAKLLKTAGTLNDVLSFVNPDNSIVVLVANQTTKTQTVDLNIGGRHTVVALSPNSLNTLLFK